MLARVAKTLLVLTAFAPVLLTFAFVEWRRGALVPLGAVCVAVALGLTLICWLILEGARQMLPVVECRIEGIRTADTEIVAYVLSYLMPLASLGSDRADPYVMMFVALFFVAIIWSSHSYHFNPILSLLGYHFYEATDAQGIAYVVVTKKSIRKARYLAKVIQLSEYILLDVDEHNA